MDRRRTLKFALAAIIAPTAFTARAASIPAPAAGQGMIVLYRPRQAKAAALQFRMTINGSSMGSLTNGKVMAQQVAPGTYTLETRSPSVDGRSSVSVSVKAGETLFVKGVALWGYPAGRTSLQVMSAAQGQAEVAKM